MKSSEIKYLVLKEGCPFIAGGILLAILGWAGGGGWLGIPFTVVAVWVVAFFRNPPRVIPTGEGLIISPADGTVTEIVETVDPYRQVPARKLSVFMSAFNVHLNRAPIAGTVESVRYAKGEFRPAWDGDSSEHNERNAILLKDPQGRSLTCVQVAGIMARRIICYIKDGARVERGVPIGLIRFGSRVDLYFPKNVIIKVRSGDKVKGGSSVLAVWKTPQGGG